MSPTTFIKKGLDVAKLMTITGSAQAIVQCLGLISGILIIRLLSTNEYALYTLVNSFIGTMTVLAECDISYALMAEGAKVWQEPKKLGAVINTGLGLRNKLGLFSLVFVIPIFIYILNLHGASWITQVLLLCSLIPTLFASFSDTILEVAPKLTQDISALQKNQLQANIGRLILTTVLVFIFPFAFLAILGNGLPRIWANIKLRKLTTVYADLSQKQDPIVRKNVLKFVKKILPVAIFYSFSSQITIWLASVLGSTQAIAQIGALGRITVFLTVISSVFATVLVPRFAKLHVNSKALLKRYFQLQLLLAMVSIVIVFVITNFRTEVLWVLGDDYMSLKSEVTLMTIVGCLGMMTGLAHNALISRGWVLPPALNIAGTILFQIALMITLDLSTVTGILIFSIANSGFSYLMLLFYFIYRWKFTNRDLSLIDANEPPDEHKV